jgi:hypothetical protein
MWNGVALPNVSQKPLIGRTVKRRSTPNINLPGSFALPSLPGERNITVDGILLIPAGSNADAVWAEFCDALPIGVTGQLSLRYDESTYYLAQVDTMDQTTNFTWSYIGYQVSFFLADPFEYEVAAQTANLVPGAQTIVGGGNVNQAPQLQFSAVAPAGGNVVVANTTTGQTVTIYLPGDGDYVLDQRTGLVTRDGANAISDLTADSRLIELLPQDNNVTLTISGGPTITNPKLVWHKRRF